MNVDTIAEQLLFTTVRVETEAAGGNGTGTAFFFEYLAGNERYPFLVTNGHVVAGATTGTLTFHRGVERKPQLGNPYRLRVTEFDRLWHPHPDTKVDVVVAPVAGLLQHLRQEGVIPFYKSVAKSLTVDPAALGEFDALEEVVFIGYPAPIWDTVNFLPVMRRGITATPIGIDYLGEKKFLVDASVFPGSSGSPVFLYSKGVHSDRQGNTIVGGRLIFAGIISSVYFQQEVNEVVMLPAPSAESPATVSKRLINIGVVFKASTVVEAIEGFLAAKGVPLAGNAPPLQEAPRTE